MSKRALVARPALPRDADGIAEVHIAAWRETYSGLIPDSLMGAEALEGRRRMWSAILGTEPLSGSVAVVERDERIVGFAFAGSSDHPDAVKGHAPARDVHLFSLYLRESEHGNGTGRALLEAVLAGRPAQLWVASANAAARRFYERQGFRDDGVLHQDPEIEGLVEVRMVR